MTLLMGMSASAQKAEVLYFKADLACCMARACDAVESDVKAVIESNFNNGDIKFSSVKISDEVNKSIVEKHNARSQSVVIVAKGKNAETVLDVSDIVRNYSRSRDKATLEKELLAKVSECIK
jgi:DNA-binding protein